MSASVLRDALIEKEIARREEKRLRYLKYGIAFCVAFSATAFVAYKVLK